MTDKIVEYKLENAEAKVYLVREMREKDLVDCLQLLNKHLQQYRIAPVMDLPEFRFKVLPKDDFIFSWVV